MAMGHFCRQRIRRRSLGTLLVAACAAGFALAGFTMADDGFQQRASIVLDWAVLLRDLHPLSPPATAVN